MDRYRNRGFTLLELMITLVLIAIVSMIALPSYSKFIHQQRLVTATNSLVTALNYARSEAVRANAPVSLCASSNGSSCAGTGTSSTDWSVGWLVYQGSSTTPSQVLRQFGTIGSGVSLTGPTGALTYRANGSVTGTATFGLQGDDCLGDQRRQIQVLLSGQAYTEPTTCV